jgi:hypothetical protein
VWAVSPGPVKGGMKLSKKNAHLIQGGHYFSHYSRDSLLSKLDRLILQRKTHSYIHSASIFAKDVRVLPTADVRV